MKTNFPGILCRLFSPVRLIFLLVFLSAWGKVPGQNAQLSLRIGAISLGKESYTDLQAPPATFPYYPATSSTFRPRECTVGLIYQYHPDTNNYRRLVAWMRPAREFVLDTWNQPDTHRVTLTMQATSFEFGGAYGLGKQYEMDRFRFLAGLEAGIGYRPGFEKSATIEIFDTGDALVLRQFNLTQFPERFSGYVKFSGGVQYMIGSRLMLGVDLQYGLQAFYLNGAVATTYKVYDPQGNLGASEEESQDVKEFFLGFPEPFELPFFVLSYRF